VDDRGDQWLRVHPSRRSTWRGARVAIAKDDFRVISIVREQLEPSRRLWGTAQPKSTQKSLANRKTGRDFQPLPNSRHVYYPTAKCRFTLKLSDASESQSHIAKYSGASLTGLPWHQRTPLPAGERVVLWHLEIDFRGVGSDVQRPVRMKPDTPSSAGALSVSAHTHTFSRGRSRRRRPTVAHRTSASVAESTFRNGRDSANLCATE